MSQSRWNCRIGHVPQEGRAKASAFNDGDSLNVGSSILLFRRFPAAPVFREKPCTEIPLRKVSRLCFGRVADAAAEARSLCSSIQRTAGSRGAICCSGARARIFGARRESDGDVSHGQRLRVTGLWLGIGFSWADTALSSPEYPCVAHGRDWRQSRGRWRRFRAAGVYDS